MIALACDHGALELKQAIMRHLDARGLAYKDFGCYDHTSCDYPDFAAPAARAVASGECERGHPLRAAQRSHVCAPDP